jgi:hypothetical protein
MISVHFFAQAQSVTLTPDGAWIPSYTVTLPSASSYAGRIYVIANRSANSVTISAFINSSEVSSTTIAANETLQIISDDTEWIKVNCSGSSLIQI